MENSLGSWGKRLSLNCVSFLPAPPYRIQMHGSRSRLDAVTEIAQFRLACFPYSYRNAETGSIREARQAGRKAASAATAASVPAEPA